jgi:hypothetical protein
MTQVTVYKLDAEGNDVWQYPARVLGRRDHCVRLEAYFNREAVDLGYVTFERGDRFVEFFYSDRWYNIFAVHQGDSERLKGWYCNVCRPSLITETAVRCEDLALDVWVPPGGPPVVLDEDEFAALDLPPPQREKGRAALDKLLALAENGRLPT